MGWFRNKKDDAEANSLEQAVHPDIVVRDEEYENGGAAMDYDGVPFNAGNEASDAVAPPSCFRRFSRELYPFQSWFYVQGDLFNGRTLDIPESFAPASCYAFFWKLLAASVAVLTLAWGFADSDAAFYMAYLTSWGVLFVSIYFCWSVLNTVLASRTPQPVHTVGWRIRFTWFFFELGAVSTAIATLLYWPLVYDPDTSEITFTSISSHGGLLLLILVDGLLVNRTPVRFQHWYGVLMVQSAYAIWTVIHAYATDIGNPDNSDNDPETNDDAIYQDVLEWNEDWKTALFWVCIILFVVSPVLFAILWVLANGCCGKDRRKYVDSVDERDERPTVNDVEEGSIFAKWR